MGEVRPGEFHGVGIDVTAGDVVPLVCRSDAPDPGGRHRIEIRRHAVVALPIRPQNCYRDVAVELLGWVEEDVVAGAVARAVAGARHFDIDATLLDSHIRRSPPGK